MTPIRNLLSDAVRYGLAAGVAGLASASAFAQTAPATTTTTTDTTKAKNLDRVEVVGSRIKRAVDYESTAPVTTLTRADIQQTGLTSTFDIINHISASDGSGLSTVTTQTNGSDGTQTVSLRNLGANRTLVLVDGKRWPTDANGVVDLSSIPVAIIERIEVLKDGASAIYGSDAIAGVINIITRKKFEGAEVNWTYGQTTKGDGEQTSEDVTIGAASERSSGVIALSRSEQKAVFAGDRSRSDASIVGCDQLLSDWPTSDPNGRAGFCGSSSPQFGRIFIANSANPATGKRTVTLDNSFHDSGDASGDPALAHQTSATGGRSYSDFVSFNPLDRYNFAPVNYLEQPAIRNNMYASGRFDITDNISAYARVSYTQRQSSQQLAQVPAGMNVPSFGPQWAFVPTPDNVFNPFTAAGKVITKMQFRNVAVGPRHNNYDFNTLGSTAGVQGTFSLGDRNFDWDVFAQYNTRNDTKIGEHYINLFNLKKAVGRSRRNPITGALECLDAAGAVIAGCVPFNVFGGPDLGLAAGVITKAEYDAMINYVSYTEVQENKNKGINWGANISGEILPLQGGMLGFAAGYEQRTARTLFQPDALVAGGGSSDNFASPTSGTETVKEWYFELDAPIFKGLTGAKELEFDLAARKSDYSAHGLTGFPPAGIDVSPGSPTNWKYSLRWKPIDDVLLRASYGDTFRAPSVNDLFAGNAENFPVAADPCNTSHIHGNGNAHFAQCVAEGVPVGGVVQPNTQIRGLAGGNPALLPEHGHDLTAGIVLSPSWDFVKGLNITVDYWRIDLKDVITTLGAQSILNLCYTGTPNSFCDLVSRNHATGDLNFVQTRQFNSATFHSDGIDFGATYKKETAWGVFGAKVDTTYVQHEKNNGNEFIGWYNGTPNWKWRTVATLDWTRGDWDASWTARYTSAMEENFGCGVASTNSQFAYPVCNHPNDLSHAKIAPGVLGYNRIGAVTYHDVQLGWKAPWKAHIAIGARNVFGKDPPITANSFASSFDASYDLPGGPFYYFQYRQDF
jgi:outer membrane receptor protein involved in Fe transport